MPNIGSKQILGGSYGFKCATIYCQYIMLSLHIDKIRNINNKMLPKPSLSTIF